MIKPPNPTGFGLRKVRENARRETPYEFMEQYYRPGVDEVVSNPASLQDVYNWLVHSYATTLALNTGQPMPWQVSPVVSEALNKLFAPITPPQQTTSQTSQQPTTSTETPQTNKTTSHKGRIDRFPTILQSYLPNFLETPRQTYNVKHQHEILVI